MIGYDPVTRLATREAVRFVGTVGDITGDAFNAYDNLISEFVGKEVRTGDDLITALQTATLEASGRPCTKAVALNTAEVASALRLLSHLPQAGNAKKFTLGDNGRVIRALKGRRDVKPVHIRLAYRRAMFEFHGDYLLQAMQALEEEIQREKQLEAFTRLLRSLVDAKLSELPPSIQGVGWQVYVQELRSRLAWLAPKGKNTKEATPEKPTLEWLRQQRHRKTAALESGGEEEAGDGEAKTFYHHFTRCKAWLTGLGLAQRLREGDVLTQEGRRILKYFREANRSPGPARIPPSAATLEDAFQLSKDSIVEAWGVYVDDSFWERGLFDLAHYGRYDPTEGEFFAEVETAFSAVKFQQVLEAPLSALRQVVFFSFLGKEKPLQPEQLSNLLFELFSERGDLYGLGRNRQGRPAFLFRKRSSGLNKTH